MEIVDCYRLLGLRTGASYEDIKASYRRLARIYHPDANPDNQQQAKERFIQLTDAYRRLTSIVKPSPSRTAGTKPANSTPNPRSASSDERNLNRSVQSTTPPAASPRKSSSPRSSPRSSPAKPPPSPPNTPSVQFAPDLSSIDRRLKQNTYEQLQQALREQRFPRAITLVEGLAQRMPNDTEVRQWQAITYQRFGRYLIKHNQQEKAKLYLRKALRTDPNNRSLWYEVERDLQRIEQVEIL
ncbi:J domain-containing protein [Egbenema bharatensis]|uniref:J domain-containing protein n=1 Tax=Egbenema bharatensis TaxID=3463334 RepID=UPI003A864980